MSPLYINCKLKSREKRQGLIVVLVFFCEQFEEEALLKVIKHVV